MRMRVELVLVFLAVILTFTLGCALGSSSIDIKIASGPAGGTMEVASAAAVEIFKKYVPEVRVSIGPGSSFSNVVMVDRNDAQIGTIPGNSAYDGWVGNPPFKSEMKNIRGMMALYPNVYQVWVLPRSGIKKFEDLIGKRVGTSQPDAGGYPASIKMMDVYGFSTKDIEKAGGKFLPLGWGTAVDALRDGKIDALLWTTTFPAPSIVDAMTTRQIDILSLDRDKIDELIKKYPGYVKITIPAGTYKEQSHDVYTFGSPVAFIVNKDLSEDLVYRMTKALFEHRDMLAQAHALLKNINKENVAHGMMVPLHPGAKKFYEEISAPLDPIDPIDK